MLQTVLCRVYIYYRFIVRFPLLVVPLWFLICPLFFFSRLSPIILVYYISTRYSLTPPPSVSDNGEAVEKWSDLSNFTIMLLLLFAMIKSIVKLFKVSVCDSVE